MISTLGAYQPRTEIKFWTYVCIACRIGLTFLHQKFFTWDFEIDFKYFCSLNSVTRFGEISPFGRIFLS
jgi:hypothetical protein